MITKEEIDRLADIFVNDILSMTDAEFMVDYWKHRKDPALEIEKFRPVLGDEILSKDEIKDIFLGLIDRMFKETTTDGKIPANWNPRFADPMESWLLIDSLLARMTCRREKIIRIAKQEIDRLDEEERKCH